MTSALDDEALIATVCAIARAAQAAISGSRRSAHEPTVRVPDAVAADLAAAMEAAWLLPEPGRQGSRPDRRIEAALRSALGRGGVPAPWRGVYVASKASNGPEWARMRDEGAPIVSTWIDESGPGETSDWADLWTRCVSEAASASALVVIHRDGERALKGALAEIGAALGAGVPVFSAGVSDQSLLAHPLVTVCASEEEAFARAFAVHRGDPEPAGDPSP